MKRPKAKFRKSQVVYFEREEVFVQVSGKDYDSEYGWLYSLAWGGDQEYDQQDEESLRKQTKREQG